MKIGTKIGIERQKTTDVFGFQLFLEKHRIYHAIQSDRILLPFEKKAYHCNVKTFK
jgi:hypothetical protein